MPQGIPPHMYVAYPREKDLPLVLTLQDGYVWVNLGLTYEMVLWEVHEVDLGDGLQKWDELKKVR